jgi:hypothetical protein
MVVAASGAGTNDVGMLWHGPNTPASVCQHCRALVQPAVVAHSFGGHLDSILFASMNESIHRQQLLEDSSPPGRTIPTARCESAPTPFGVDFLPRGKTTTRQHGRPAGYRRRLCRFAFGGFGLAQAGPFGYL